MSQPRNAGQLTDLLLDLLSFEPENRPNMVEIRDQLADFADMGDDAVPTRMLATHRSAPRRQGVHTLDRRAAQAEISTAEMMAQSEPISEPDAPPVRPARAGAHPTRSHRVAQTAPPEPPRNRKTLLFVGGFVVGLVIVGGALYTLFGGTPPSSPAAQSNSASSSAAVHSTAPATSAVGKTQSIGKANVTNSINQVVDFYRSLSHSQFTTAWGPPTPAAQQVYGSQQGFQTYWTQNQVTTFNTVDTSEGGATLTAR